MRVVRFDTLAPGGAPLDVHPRVTLLRGASPELRRRLEAALRSIAGHGPTEESGVIEVSGVQLALDPPTLAQLQLDGTVDPVLRLARRGAARGGAPGSTASAPDVVVVSNDEAALRLQLREVTTERTALGRRMDQARAGLDSFSTASLEVCLGQIDALEARRASLRVDWERDRGEQDRRRAAAAAQLASLQQLVERLRVATALEDRLHEALEDLRRAGETTEPDLAARQLAAQLDAAVARVRELDERHARSARRMDDLSLAVDRASAAAEAAEGAPQVDREVVQRLEHVRDEIFAVDDRQRGLGATRSKRRLAELRSEEAILLDRLGFDTYSAFVMGIPSVRAELERASQRDAATAEVEALRSEAAELQAQLGRDAAAREDAARQLRRLAGEALALTDPQATLPPAGELAREVAAGGAAAHALSEHIARLRDRTTEDRAAAASALQRIHGIVSQLASTVGDTTVAPGPVAVAPLVQPPGQLSEHEDVVQVAQRWGAWVEQARTWLSLSGAAVADLQRRMGDDEAHDPARIARWAEVEAELDQALDRLTVAQERVRVHEAATELLASLRVEELELRERERDLLLRISQADAAVVPPAPRRTPGSSGDDGGDVGGSADTPPPAPDPAPSEPAALEWSVISRLARQRTASFVGTLPMLVDGVPEDPEAAARVLERLARMSELIQVVVLSDDDRATAWADGLGDGARRIEL
jgi:hypothetical protein